MIDLNLLSKIRSCYSEAELPFLNEMRQDLQRRKPYAGLRVYHNIPLTVSTILKVENLLLGGAEVMVSCLQSMPPSDIAVNILRQAHVPLDLQRQKLNESYDIYLDCGAELLNAPAPKVGTVELTATGSKIYKRHSDKLTYPVVSVDDCLLKNLETMGTGDGFARAIIEILNQPLTCKKFVVFGCGKVGRGVVTSLSRYTRDIVIVEKKLEIVERMRAHGLSAYLSGRDNHSIRQSLQDAFCVVTATGEENCISKAFEREDFDNVHLANMGALDEFGYKFSKDDVLCEKVPINFTLLEPTKMRFLDPIFYAHNQAILLLMDGRGSGYFPFSTDVARYILNKWQDYHQDRFTVHALQQYNTNFGDLQRVA